MVWVRPQLGQNSGCSGYAKIGLSFDKLDMHYNQTPVLLDGVPLIENKAKWKEIVSADEFSITLD